jgi:peptidyl-prolyl cis-trans isomerase SurA
MKASLDELITIVPDSVMSCLWRYKDTSFKDLRPLVEMPNRTYNVLDVARYIKRHQKSERNRTTIPYYVRNKYNEFIDSVTIVYADSQLENEHADFAEVVDEYRRGLMIFNYNEKMIWGKAVNDSVGFAQYYARESSTKHLDNPADSLYFWKKRARLVILDVADSTMRAPNKAQKMLVKAAKRNMGSLEMKQMLSEKCKNINGDEPVSLDLQLVEYSRQNILQNNEWNKGVYLHPYGHGYRAIVVEDIIAPVIKSQREARGYYLNGYQNEVEENLNQTLRKKYNVKIHWDVVNKINY